MAIALESLASVLDRAAKDPGLLADLVANPLGMAQRLGVHLTGDDLKALVGVPGATDAELVEVMRARLAHHFTGCGGCSSDT